MRFIIYYIVFFLPCCSNLFSQDIAADLAAIGKAMSSYNYKTSIRYSYYNGNIKTKITMAKQEKNGKSYWAFFDNQLVFYDDAYYLFINEKTKDVFLSKPLKNTEQFDAGQIIAQLKKAKSTQPLVSEKSKGYRIEFENQDENKFKEIEIRYNPENMFIEKIVMVINQPPVANKIYANDYTKLEIEYLNTSIFPGEIKDAHKISDFITHKDGKISLAGNYSEYKLFNAIL